MSAVFVSAWRSWSLGGPDARLQSLPELADGLSFHAAPDPPRPDGVPPGSWRRFSRMARLGAACAGPLLESRADRDTLAVFWGTGLGEFTSSTAFLRTLFTKGAAGASPLHFQNSVHNAAAGHLSIAYGLRGPSETICGGPHTTARLLERAFAWAALRGRPALVVAADDLGPDVEAGYAYMGLDSPCSEGAAAILIEPSGPASLRLEAASAPSGARDWCRHAAWPEEQVVSGVSVGRALDRRLGLYPSAELVAIVSCLHSRAGAVALDGGRVVVG